MHVCSSGGDGVLGGGKRPTALYLTAADSGCPVPCPAAPGVAGPDGAPSWS